MATSKLCDSVAGERAKKMKKSPFRTPFSPKKIPLRGGPFPQNVADSQKMSLNVFNISCCRYWHFHLERYLVPLKNPGLSTKRAHLWLRTVPIRGPTLACMGSDFPLSITMFLATADTRGRHVSEVLPMFPKISETFNFSIFQKQEYWDTCTSVPLQPPAHHKREQAIPTSSAHEDTCKAAKKLEG